MQLHQPLLLLATSSQHKDTTKSDLPQERLPEHAMFSRGERREEVLNETDWLIDSKKGKLFYTIYTYRGCQARCLRHHVAIWQEGMRDAGGRNCDWGERRWDAGLAAGCAEEEEAHVCDVEASDYPVDFGSRMLECNCSYVRYMLLRPLSIPKCTYLSSIALWTRHHRIQLLKGPSHWAYKDRFFIS